MASKAQYEDNSNQPPEYQSHPESREHANSLRSQDLNPMWESRDNSSDKSLVDGGALVTRTWTQKWQNPDGTKALHKDPESGHELRSLQP